MTVIKRTGKSEALSKKKIFDSICKANDNVAVEDKLTKKAIQRISEEVFNK